MCRPGHASSREASAGGHIGPPLRDMGWCSGTNGDWRRTGPPPPGRDGARPLRGTGGVRGGVRLGCGFRQPNFGTKFGASVMGIGPYAPRGDEGRHAGSSCPTGGCGEPPRLPWGAAHSGASAPAGARDGRESRQRLPQKCPATSDNPSVSLRLTAPFTQGSLRGHSATQAGHGDGPPRSSAPTGAAAVRGVGGQKSSTWSGRRSLPMALCWRWVSRSRRSVMAMRRRMSLAVASRAVPSE